MTLSGATLDGNGPATKLAASTVNRVLAAVSSFYEYAILSGMWDQANPLEKRPDPALARVSERHQPFMGRASRQRPIRRAVHVKTVQRVPRPLDDAQLTALLAELRRVRDRAIVLLMLQGGLRPGEVLGLRLEDIAYGRRVMVRHRDDHPKGVRSKSRYERVVDLHEPEALAVLSEYVMTARPQDGDSPLVFLIGGWGKRRLEPLGYDGLVRMFSRAAARAGVREPWVTPHALRHTHATSWEGRHAGADPAKAPRSRLARVDAHLHACVRPGRDRRLPPGAGRARPRGRAGCPVSGRNVSTAAMLAAPSAIASRPEPAHCPAEEWQAHVEQAGGNRQFHLMKVRYQRQFVERWPRLASWFGEPLTERVGRLLGEPFHRPSFPISFRARTYLIYLGLRGYATFDYPWLFGPGQLGITEPATVLGIDLDTAQLVRDAVALGFSPNSARQAMHWSVTRIALHTGIFDVAAITGDHIAEALQAIREFADHPDLERFYPSRRQFLDGAGKGWITHLHQLQVVLFHRGQLHTQPRKLMPSRKQPMALPPVMQAAADKWLAARRLTDAPSTVEKLELALRTFGDWLAEQHPEITSFADVTRDHCLAWITHIAEAPSGRRDGKPLGVMSRIQRISGLSQFFRDTAAWQYPDVPGHTLIGAGDAPKYTEKVPRFIPDHELDQLMPVIDAIACPFQRAALLVARWSGARRDEIRRLPVDCLDRYPEGTARLRLPGRKTYKERVVPLHEDAAQALQAVIDLRKDAPERPFTDERTGEEIRYLFMGRGKLLSGHYLFESPIQDACKAVGLVRPGGRGGSGRGTVSAHRFRHTVGTQLAERGAKLHTIMKVLGHTSVNMALVYANPRVLHQAGEKPQVSRSRRCRNSVSCLRTAAV